MSKTIGLLIAICLLMSFEGCAQNKSKENSETKQTTYRRISAEEAKKMLDENPKAILLDVRTEGEYRDGHIPGAILLPVSDIQAKAAEMLPDKNALILVYCRSGHRAAIAAHQLTDMGYTNVYNMGGIIDWHYNTEKG
jgi:rhodanese-related sulfurtransferase